MLFVSFLPLPAKLTTLVSLYEKFAYSAKDTLYSTIGEYDYSSDYTQIDECCIYVNFALMFIEKNESIDFMKVRLLEFAGNKNLEIYKMELKDEFNLFYSDLCNLRNTLNPT